MNQIFSDDRLIARSPYGNQQLVAAGPGVVLVVAPQMRGVQRSCHVTDDSVPYLATLSSLAELNLKGTRLTEQGQARLKQALPQLTIRTHSE